MNHFVKNNLNLYCMDCMDLMAKYPDNHFDLAIVDPPYGGGGIGDKIIEGGKRFGGWFDKYKASRDGGKKYWIGIMHQSKLILMNCLEFQKNK